MRHPPESDEVGEFLRQSFVTGAAVTLPLLVTVLVLSVVVDFVSRQLDPLVGLFTALTGIEPTSEVALKLFALAVLVCLVLVVGAVAERRQGRSGIGAAVDTLVARIPGVGSLYRSLDEMSNLLLDNDTDSFREVKLVEFPERGSYAVAFLTADTPSVVESATDDDGMSTLFLPLAPNPVMGGYVLHVTEERVHDVDMTVEEGIRSIVTSGVATGHREETDLSDGMLDRLDRRLEAIEDAVTLDDIERYAADASAQIEERVAAARSRGDESETDRTRREDETDRPHGTETSRADEAGEESDGDGPS